MAPLSPPYAPFVNFKGLQVIPVGSNTPTFSVNASGDGYFAGTVRIDGELLMTDGTVVTGLFNLTDGLVVSGSVGPGHASPTAQIEIDNVDGGPSVFSMFQRSADSEAGISVTSILSDGSVVQQGSMFTVFVAGDNTFNSYATATGMHLIGSAGDTTPFVAFSNNAMKLLAGDTSGLPWDTAPSTNALEIGTTARNASLFLNDTDFVFNASLFGGVGSFGVGTVAISTVYFYEEMPAIVGPAAGSFYRHLINNVNAVTVGTGTSAVISTMGLAEPNITLAGNTVTLAATLYIANAPTEGTTNHALYVASGGAFFTNTVTAASYVVGVQAGTSGTFGSVTVVNGIVVSGT